MLFRSSAPEDNLNGPIEYGGYRPLRLDLSPFNETVEVVDEWENELFGVTYHEQVCILRGNRVQRAPMQTWAKKLIKRVRS